DGVLSSLNRTQPGTTQLGANTTVQWQTPYPGLDDALIGPTGNLISPMRNWVIQMYIDDLSGTENQQINTAGDPVFQNGSNMNPLINTSTNGANNLTGTDLAVPGTMKPLVATFVAGSFFELLSPAGDAPFTYDDIEGRFVYSVVFNASTIEAASQWAIVDNSLFFMPNQPPAPTPELPTVLYNIGALPMSDWVAVPEPSTAGMLLLGLLLVRRVRVVRSN
ncbi:MAG: PEP-CTERM sorting domain-containing protein, partial [Verrucomicrobiota bacterium]